ncbi:MAG: GAF domain-containing protein [Motilibacteraceae bacterium]
MSTQGEGGAEEKTRGRREALGVAGEGADLTERGRGGAGDPAQAASPAGPPPTTPAPGPAAGPAAGPSASPSAGPMTFPAVARLELDELLVQLVDRAQEVLRTQGRLTGLVYASQQIAADLDLPVLLQRIVDVARELIGCRYAALGVLGREGGLAQFIHSGLEPALAQRIGQLPSGQHGLLGQLIADPQPLRLDDVAVHDASSGYPPGHPPMHTFLGVPVRIRDRVFGNLYLTEKADGAGFTAEDEELLQSLAAAAASAIDNARLYDLATRRERWLTASREITNALLDPAASDTPLQTVAAAVRTAAQADVTVVLLADDAGRLSVAAADGAGVQRGMSVPPTSVSGGVFVKGEPLLVEDLRKDQRWTGGLLKSLDLGPVMVVPLVARGRIRGTLAIGNHGAPVFTEDDLDLAVDAAAQAALALEMADAQTAARRVEVLEDRSRIARDLHDHVVQQLFATGLGLQALASGPGGQQLASALTSHVDALDATIRQIRSAVFALQHEDPASGRGGLRARLLEVCEAAAPALGFAPAVQFEGAVDARVPTPVAEDLVAVLREALSNAARHAGANRVGVEVRAGADDVVLEVRDDGRGVGQPGRRSGLANMVARATGRGGGCEIGPGVDGGTTVRWWAPLSA